MLSFVFFKNAPFHILDENVAKIYRKIEGKALFCHHPLPITAEFSLQDNKARQGRERKYYERPFYCVKIDGYF